MKNLLRASTRFVIVIGTAGIALSAAFGAHAQSALPSVQTPVQLPKATASKASASKATPASKPRNTDKNAAKANEAIGASPLPSVTAPIEIAPGANAPTSTQPSTRPAVPAREGASVAGISVRTLSDTEALRVLERKLSPTLQEKVVLSDGYATWTATREELGARLPLKALLAQARQSQSDVPLRFAVDKDATQRALQKLAPQINRIVAASTDGVVPSDEDAPRRAQRAILGVEGSVFRVQRALETSPLQDRVELVVGFAPLPVPTPAASPTPFIQSPTSTRPTVAPSSKPFLKNTPYLLARFSTPYDPGVVGRTENLRLAAKFINGTVVKPGRVFSTNLAIGERRASQGWKEAKMFANGQIVTGMASGICQSSTTLYNAALLAGLPIIERHPHTFRVSYAPASRDAAIYWGSKDMKFRNNTGGPILVRTYLKDNRFHVELYGVKPVTAEIEISSRVLSRSNGVKSEAFRTIKLDGKSTTEKLSRDYYRPHP